ncbi:MAG: protein kinase [Verrucomicrobiota bacterium]|nr:protein kinase [Verrucomicrobiota bacterium]
MNTSQEQQLEELLDQWEASLESGETVDPASLCEACPELLPALKSRIASLNQINALLGTQVEPAERTNDPPGTTFHTDEPLTATIDLADSAFHAEGALGRVYVARDGRLNREVAAKFMQKRHLNNKERRRQFWVEAEITSRLYHPGIVPVHGMGETAEGCPFYVMQFARGETFQQCIHRFYEEGDQWTKQRRNLEFRNQLAHFVTVCNTIAYAHNRGIIHRDLKPENIIIGHYGETMVVDWGLAIPIARDASARASGEKTLFPTGHENKPPTQSDIGAGTPAYMSPEQASGQTPITLSSDIYSLGSILYKILCGSSPVDGVEGNLTDIRKHVIEGQWAHPRNLRADCPRPLEAVCMKAMHQKPSRRYSSALELANEVERYLADEKVQAYKESALETPLRFFRQHRRMARLTIVSVSLLLAVLVGSALKLGMAARQGQVVNQTLLKSAAKLTAVTVQMEMDARWFLLQQEATQQRLIEALGQSRGLLTDAMRVPFSDLIQGVVGRARLDGVQAESWFICNGDGIQLARHPSGSSIGGNFAHRDYFHGNAVDLSPGERGSPPHIIREYLSVPYASSNDQKLKVALTCPVFSHPEGTAQRTFLGVLGMSIKLGDFEVLRGNLADGQIAVLANSGWDHFTGKAEKGLILHHPNLRSTEDSIESPLLPRLGKSLLQRLRESPGGSYTTDYIDPAAQNPKERRKRWTAAFEPVRLRNEFGWDTNRGWIVIVQRPN